MYIQKTSGYAPSTSELIRVYIKKCISKKQYSYMYV